MNYSTYGMYTPFQEMEDVIPVTTKHSYPFKPFVDQVNNCAAQCYYMMSMLIGKSYGNVRANQINLLHDCARMCESQSVYTVTGSQFDRAHASFCANVCEMCGNECMKYQDIESQNCAKICLDCAKACRRHAGMM